jgi:predicted CopG family antitoxin
MARTKTIAVTEDVWDRLRQMMKRDRAKSMNEALSKLIDRAADIPRSKFGVHKRMKLRFTQEEHEETTRDRY